MSVTKTDLDISCFHFLGIDPARIQTQRTKEENTNAYYEQLVPFREMVELNNTCILPISHFNPLEDHRNIFAKNNLSKVLRQLYKYLGNKTQFKSTKTILQDISVLRDIMAATTKQKHSFLQHIRHNLLDSVILFLEDKSHKIKSYKIVTLHYSHIQKKHIVCIMTCNNEYMFKHWKYFPRYENVHDITVGLDSFHWAQGSYLLQRYEMKWKVKMIFLMLHECFVQSKIDMTNSVLDIYDSDQEYPHQTFDMNETIDTTTLYFDILSLFYTFIRDHNFESTIWKTCNQTNNLYDQLEEIVFEMMGEAVNFDLACFKITGSDRCGIILYTAKNSPMQNIILTVNENDKLCKFTRKNWQRLDNWNFQA